MWSEHTSPTSRTFETLHFEKKKKQKTLGNIELYTFMCHYFINYSQQSISWSTDKLVGRQELSNTQTDSHFYCEIICYAAAVWSDKSEYFYVKSLIHLLKLKIFVSGSPLNSKSVTAVVVMWLYYCTDVNHKKWDLSEY